MRFRLRVTDAGGLSAEDEAAVTVAPAGAPLTARAEQVPATHDGTAFRFRLFFSEQVGLSFLTLRDDSFAVTGGTVTQARRLVRRSNVGWEITVAPESNASVRLVLAADRPCDSAGAICTRGGERLSNRLEIAVPVERQ